MPLPRKRPGNNHKRQGEVAQLLFLARAAQSGLQVLDPYGDSSAYDVAVEAPSGAILRVQVKSTRLPRRGSSSIRVELIGPNRKPYTRRQIDFVAVLLISEAIWYIFPYAALRRGHRLRRYVQIPHFSERHNQWLPYKSAFHLLRCHTSERP